MLQRILLPVLLLLATPGPTSAQTPATTFRISGRTVSAVNGQPLGHTEVSIATAEQFDSTVLQKVLTREDGGFSFSGLTPGKYLLIGTGEWLPEAGLRTAWRLRERRGGGVRAHFRESGLPPSSRCLDRWNDYR